MSAEVALTFGVKKGFIFKETLHLVLIFEENVKKSREIN